MLKAPKIQEDFEHSLFKTFFSCSNDFIGAADQESMKLVYINKSGLDVFEVEDSATMIGMSLWDLIRPCSLQNNIEDVIQQLDQGHKLMLECEFKTTKKNKFWGRGHFSSFNNEGKVFYFIRIEKIDRVRKAEETIEQEQKKFEAFMENASAGVVLINESGLIIASNPLSAQLFGYKIGSLNNMPLEMLLPENIRYKHRSYEMNYFTETNQIPVTKSRDVMGLKSDGSLFPLEVKLGTYKYNKETFVMAFLTDITGRKESENAIRSLNLELEQKIRERTEALASTVVKLEQQIKETEEAEKELEEMLAKEKHLNELKSRFVSIASHEFKTPLSTILSSAYLLQMYTQTEEQGKRNKHIERIVHSVNNLTGILNEFLNVGKIEEGKVILKLSEFNLEAFMREMISDCIVLLKDGQDIDYTAEGPSNFYTDITLFRHIILNLITNAIKFSNPDSIIIIKSIISEDQLTVTISDQGIGIPEEEKKHLFDRFFRASNALSMQGTGLGLHIVSRYTEILGGSIECKSQLGVGTTFIITIPTRTI